MFSSFDINLFSLNMIFLKKLLPFKYSHLTFLNYVHQSLGQCLDHNSHSAVCQINVTNNLCQFSHLHDLDCGEPTGILNKLCI
jgi:hypothetical protein